MSLSRKVKTGDYPVTEGQSASNSPWFTRRHTQRTEPRPNRSINSQTTDRTIAIQANNHSNNPNKDTTNAKNGVRQSS